jgi:tripeptidyl-peptidase-1
VEYGQLTHFFPAIHNITEGTKTTAGNEFGVFESLGDVYSQEDLDLFFEHLSPYVEQLQSTAHH